MQIAVGSRRGVETDPAEFGLGDVAAEAAELDVVLHPAQYFAEPVDIGAVGGDEIEGDPLRALRPDTGESPQFIDQILYGALIHRWVLQPWNASGQRTHGGLGQLMGSPLPIADGGNDEVGQRLGVLRVDGLGGDDQVEQLSTAGHGCRDQTATGGADDALLDQRRLGGLDLGLHLLGLLQELLHVGRRATLSGAAATLAA